ncbi:CLUMA_CG006397, isoform A [Clunio marinus]|uniref:CLUMA_CG006397, isoform A n=1 Tax=Clunio marinus TaxID=568069 RepID=A0A1J1I1T1_9DIPT|nr:CLUMA_CG006397, isoform A [Clunio marinus]
MQKLKNSTFEALCFGLVKKKVFQHCNLQEEMSHVAAHFRLIHKGRNSRDPKTAQVTSHLERA